MSLTNDWPWYCQPMNVVRIKYAVFAAGGAYLASTVVFATLYKMVKTNDLVARIVLWEYWLGIVLFVPGLIIVVVGVFTNIRSIEMSASTMPHDCADLTMPETWLLLVSSIVLLFHLSSSTYLRAELARTYLQLRPFAASRVRSFSPVVFGRSLFPHAKAYFEWTKVPNVSFEREIKEPDTSLSCLRRFLVICVDVTIVVLIVIHFEPSVLYILSEVVAISTFSVLSPALRGRVNERFRTSAVAVVLLFAEGAQVPFLFDRGTAGVVFTASITTLLAVRLVFLPSLSLSNAVLRRVLMGLSILFVLAVQSFLFWAFGGIILITFVGRVIVAALEPRTTIERALDPRGIEFSRQTSTSVVSLWGMSDFPVVGFEIQEVFVAQDVLWGAALELPRSWYIHMDYSVDQTTVIDLCAFVSFASNRTTRFLKQLGGKTSFFCDCTLLIRKHNLRHDVCKDQRLLKATAALDGSWQQVFDEKAFDGSEFAELWGWLSAITQLKPKAVPEMTRRSSEILDKKLRLLAANPEVPLNLYRRVYCSATLAYVASTTICLLLDAEVPTNPSQLMAVYDHLFELLLDYWSEQPLIISSRNTSGELATDPDTVPANSVESYAIQGDLTAVIGRVSKDQPCLALAAVSDEPARQENVVLALVSSAAQAFCHALIGLKNIFHEVLMLPQVLGTYILKFVEQPTYRGTPEHRSDMDSATEKLRCVSLQEMGDMLPASTKELLNTLLKHYDDEVLHCEVVRDYRYDIGYITLAESDQRSQEGCWTVRVASELL